jgi:restriction endonuclease S subunit
MTREYLLDNFELKRVIKMKGQFFSNTGIQPSILFFENTGFSTSEIEFWEVEQGSDGTIIENMLLSVPRDNLDESCSLDMRRYQEVAIVANTGKYPMVKLGDVCDSQNGKILSMVDIKEGGGEYPIMSGGRSYCGNYNKYNRENETISISKTGSSSGCAVWHNTRYWAADCMTLTPKDNSNTLLKYVYYLMITKQDYIYENYQRTGVMPHCYWQDISQFQFCLPPLPIQQEIVTALDLIYNNAATAKAAAASVKSQMTAVVHSVGVRGFEQKKLEQLVDISKGTLQATKCDNGEYPVISISNKWTHSTFSDEGEHVYIASTSSGASSGPFETVIKYYNGKCSSTSLMQRLSTKNTNILTYMLPTIH